MSDLVEARFESELFGGSGGVGGIEFADLVEFGEVVFGDEFLIDLGDGGCEGFGLFDAVGGFGFDEVLVAGEADFLEVVEVFDVSGGAAGLVAGFCVGSAIGVGEEDGGVALDLELLAKARVLFDGFGFHFPFDFWGLREIEFEEDESFWGGGLELLVAEHFLFEFDAPSAPIGSGEIHEDVLGFCFGGEFGFFEIDVPTFTGESVAEEEGCDSDNARERASLHAGS